MADVFISYAREDQPRAAQVAHALEAMGLSTFWDTDIPPGQTWADYIEGKLAQCKAVIVLWSAHSTQSQWVREEARMGRDRGRLIPAMLDGSAPPFGFGEVQAANLATWRAEANHPEWQRFSQAVYGAVHGAGATPPSQAPASAAAGGWTTSAPPPPPQAAWSAQRAQAGASAATGGDLGFVGYVQKCLRLFIDGKGRARRAEYWYWVLFTAIVGVVAYVLDYALTGGGVMYNPSGGVIGALANIALLAPSLSVMSRRFHDVGLSGWLVAAVFGVFFVAGMVASVSPTLGGLLLLGACIGVIVVLVRPGQPGSNQYGEDPKGA
ncbi:DUF805 domain-containing protein [Terricaulis sp.]|uniref:TIR domain-containing protein n=1 Tax=Terricaulis sp. TaxID=2768686 RepID=UPI0037838E34